MINTFKYLGLIFSTLIFAQQDSVKISQQDLSVLVQNHLQIAINQSEITSAETDLLQFRATYLPNVKISYSGIHTNNPLMAFGSKLNQAVVQSLDFNPDFLNNPDPIFNFETKLEVEQPIYNRETYWQKKAAEVKVNAFQLKSERFEDYLEMKINKAYMMLQFAYKSVKVLEQAQKNGSANKKVIDDYFKNGLIQKSDVLYMDARLNEIESQLFAAKSKVQNVSDYILMLSNQELGSLIYQPENELTYNSDLGILDQDLNTERADISAQTKALEIYDLMLKSSKSKFLPSFNAFGNFALYDENPIGFGANGYLLGVVASWNLFDGKKSDSEQRKFQVEKAKAEIELENYQQQSQLELNNAWRDVLSAQKRVELSKLAWQQTEEAYRILKNRFDQGLEKPSDLLTSESYMSQKELAYQQAIFEYNSTVEYLKFLKK